MDVPDPIFSSNRILSPYTFVKTADRKFWAVRSTGRTSLGMAQGGDTEEANDVRVLPNKMEGDENDGLDKEPTGHSGTVTRRLATVLDDDGWKACPGSTSMPVLAKATQAIDARSFITHNYEP